MERRGLSAIVVTIVLVLVVFIAIMIVFITVSPLFKKSDVDIVPFNTRLEIVREDLCVSGNFLKITVKRATGEESFQGVSIVFDNDSEQHNLLTLGNFASLEKKQIIVNLTNNATNLPIITGWKKISVRPLIDFKPGKTVLGSLEDTYVFTGLEPGCNAFSPPPVLLCGNGRRDAGENCMNCPADFGVCPVCNHNVICDRALGENCSNCPGDCGACPLANTPPYFLVNMPLNGSSLSVSPIVLNVSVFDRDNDFMEVWMYAGRDPNTLASSLVYHNLSVPNGTTLLYSLRALPGTAFLGMVMFLHFDNNSALGENDTFFYDSSGNGNHGRCYSYAGCPREVSGLYSGAVDHGNDSLNRSIEVQNNPSLIIKNNITIMTWINKNQDAVNDSRIIEMRASRKPGVNNPNDPFYYDTTYAIEMESSFNPDRPKCEFTLGSSFYELWSTYAMPNGMWTHVACTYDGKRIRLYINGALNASMPASGDIVYNASRNLYIGNLADPVRAPRPFFGKIDEAGLFNRTLNVTEIQQFSQLQLQNYYWITKARDTFGNVNTTGNYSFRLSGP